jgi:hypothetical protein
MKDTHDVLHFHQPKTFVELHYFKPKSDRLEEASLEIDMGASIRQLI